MFQKKTEVDGRNDYVRSLKYYLGRVYPKVTYYQVLHRNIQKGIDTQTENNMYYYLQRFRDSSTEPVID